jgi:hypothetical protein
MVNTVDLDGRSALWAAARAGDAESCIMCVQHGRMVQVDPIKPTLQPPGNKNLKVRCHKPLSNVAFNVNMRLCSMAATSASWTRAATPSVPAGQRFRV